MIGAIIGDTIGSVYEFNNTKDYNFELLGRGCSFTDDSVLTAAVAYWQLSAQNGVLDQRSLEKCLCNFAARYPHPMGGYGGGFHCWLNAAVKKPYNSWGNGSAMRVSSVGWMYDTLEETEKVAELSASVTHNHPEGIKGAQATTAAIWMARNGRTKQEIKEYIESRFGYDLSRSWSEIQPGYGWEDSCQGTCPAAIIAFLDSTDFEDALRKAVSLGGDSDTLACITCSIAEAFYKSIPEDIVRFTLDRLPSEFLDVLATMMKDTAYGKVATAYIPSEYLEGRGLKNNPMVNITPDFVTALKPGEVFVFGSNLRGEHLGGAARIAVNNFGAIWGQGVGLQGQSYAIPTMQGGVDTIRPYVDEFIAFAKAHPDLFFYVTRIGCGIAGFRDSEIAPLFAEAKDLENVALPKSFVECLK